jgi:hypothetical protein
MKEGCVLPKIIHVMPANSTARMQNVFPECGLVTETMIVEITLMKMLTIALSTPAHQMNSVAIMDAVSSRRGNVIMKMIVRMDLMRKIVHIHLVLTESSLA